MPNKQEYQNTIRQLMEQGAKAFNVENREAWGLLIDNGMVRDSNGNVIRSQQIGDLWNIAHDDALVIYDDPNVNPYVLTQKKDGAIPEKAKISFDLNRMSPDTFIEKVGTGMPKPKSPGIGSWINHAWERLFGRPGNTKVNQYYEKKAVYDKLAYDRKIAAGYKVEKPENVAKFELEQLSKLGTNTLNDVAPIDVSDPAEVMKNAKVQSFLHTAAVNRAYWFGQEQNGISLGGQEYDIALDKANEEARQSIQRNSDPEARANQAAEAKARMKAARIERAVGKISRHIEPHFNQELIDEFRTEMVRSESDHLTSFILSSAATPAVFTHIEVLHRQNKLDANSFSLMVEQAYAHTQPGKDPDFSPVQNQLGDMLAGKEKNIGEYFGQPQVPVQNQPQKNLNVPQ